MLYEVDESLRIIDVAMLTSWNTKCGIAENSWYLSSSTAKKAGFSLIAQAAVEMISQERELGVQRLWQNR
jgi:hypothetical protein